MFFGKFGVLCFLLTPVLRFALLPYNQRVKPIYESTEFPQRKPPQYFLKCRKVHEKKIEPIFLTLRLGTKKLIIRFFENLCKRGHMLLVNIFFQKCFVLLWLLNSLSSLTVRQESYDATCGHYELILENRCFSHSDSLHPINYRRNFTLF